jgi:hypothetical protein
MKIFLALPRIGVLGRYSYLQILLFLEPELNGGNGVEPTEPEWVTLGTAFTNDASFFLQFFLIIIFNFYFIS